jgi:hypothetical protein
VSKAVKKAISLAAHLAAEVRAIAREENGSLSAVVTSEGLRIRARAAYAANGGSTPVRSRAHVRNSRDSIGLAMR